VVREDPHQKGLLYAGTETGMYISFNDGSEWKAFQLNLPIVPITDLALKDDNLVVATQGRSLWIIDDLSALHQMAGMDKSAEMILYQPKDAYRTKGSTASTPSLTEGANHPNGVITHYYLKDLAEKDSVSLTYLSQQGDTLATFSRGSKEKDKKLEVKKGGNTFVWNTQGEGAKELEGMILWWANLEGAKAVPGEYKVSLNFNGTSSTRDFKILPDPRAEATVDGMQKQHDFISEVNKTVEKAHQSIKKIRKITTQLEAFTKQYSDNEQTRELVEKAKKMKEGFSEIEKALYQTKNQSSQDPLNFPIRLTNKLGHLNSLVALDDFPPTDQDIAVKKELSSNISSKVPMIINIRVKGSTRRVCSESCRSRGQTITS
jgi:hypothetical protein